MATVVFSFSYQSTEEVTLHDYVLKSSPTYGNLQVISTYSTYWLAS